MLHCTQDIEPCLPQAKVERSNTHVIRRRELPSEATLPIEKITGQKPYPTQSRIRGTMLIKQAANPQTRIIWRIRRQRPLTERSQAISNPKKRDRIASKLGL